MNGQKRKYAFGEECGRPHEWGAHRGVFLTPHPPRLLFHFNSLNGRIFFCLGAEYSLLGESEWDFDSTSLHQFLLFPVRLQKPPHLRCKSHFPLLYERQACEVVQQSPAACVLGQALWVLWSGFPLKVSQSLIKSLIYVLVVDTIPPCFMVSLSVKQGGGFAFCLMSVWGGCSWVQPCLSCLILRKTSCNRREK